MLFQRCCPSRWPGRSTWWRRMWVRSGHRAYGLDIYIYIYIYILFFYCRTLWLCGNLLSRVSCICFCVQEWLNISQQRGEGLKVSAWITHKGLAFQTLNYPGKLWKNHANMFSDALAFLETLLPRGMSLFPFFLCRHTASALSTAGTHTGGVQ